MSLQQHNSTLRHGIGHIQLLYTARCANGAVEELDANVTLRLLKTCHSAKQPVVVTQGSRWVLSHGVLEHCIHIDFEGLDQKVKSMTDNDWRETSGKVADLVIVHQCSILLLEVCSCLMYSSLLAHGHGSRRWAHLPGCEAHT